MKLPILLGALLLSATPAVADNFLYVRCKTEVTETTLRSNQVVNSEQGDMIFYFKTDLKNSRIMNSTRGEWDKLEIKNGVAFEDKVNVLDGLNYHTKTSMEIQPLGKIVVTPVLIGPFPCIIGSEPSIIVLQPTKTSGTSVILLNCPVSPSKGNPNSLPLNFL